MPIEVEVDGDWVMRQIKHHIDKGHIGAAVSDEVVTLDGIKAYCSEHGYHLRHDKKAGRYMVLTTPYDPEKFSDIIL